MELARAPHHNSYRRVVARAVKPGELDAAVGTFFREDATHLTHCKAGHVMATLNNLVIGLLRVGGFSNLGATRRYCGADLTNALALLSPPHR